MKNDNINLKNAEDLIWKRSTPPAGGGGRCRRRRDGAAADKIVAGGDEKGGRGRWRRLALPAGDRRRKTGSREPLSSMKQRPELCGNSRPRESTAEADLLVV